MPIPAYVSQILLDSTTSTVKIGGSTASLSTSLAYYLISSKSSAGVGQSLLAAIKAALDSVTPVDGATGFPVLWTVQMSKIANNDYRIQLSTNASSSNETIDVSVAPNLWLNLGFAAGNIVVNNNTTVTANYPSLWWWSPDVAIHRIGPVAFDPAISYGHATSAGTAQRSPTMVPAYTYNGVQREAVYEHLGVQGDQKIHKANGVAAYTNLDLETWWANGPALGRRLLWWRDRDNACGSNAPGAGSASPYKHVEYAPNADLRANFPAVPMVDGLLYHWNVKLGLWVTSNGETPVT